MKVKMTDFLRQELLEIGEDPEGYIQDFIRWKSAGPAGQYSFYFFGKDGAYKRPLSSNKEEVLRHVHLAPHPTSRYYLKWNIVWDRAKRYRRIPGRRVSNTVLVYADGGPSYGYLLITILWEDVKPGAHKIAQMKTAEDVETMLDLVFIAEEFVYYGKCDC